jgi:hypothetical protein
MEITLECSQKAIIKEKLDGMKMLKEQSENHAPMPYIVNALYS